MKTVLCYGDSNTWGSIASYTPPDGPSARFGEEQRWSGVMRGQLGAGYRVIEEGLCGRTTVYAAPGEEYKNGEPYLLPCLLSHRPLDLVIVMLGSNDLRAIFHPSRERLGEGISRLADQIKACPTCGSGNVPPEILILSPILVRKPEGRQDFYLARGEKQGEELSACFHDAYARVAKEKGCFFLDAAQVAAPSLADGLHMDEASHRALGKAVAAKVKEILGK